MDSAQITPQERIWCIFEEFDDRSVPQVVEENFEVTKAVPQECVSERTVEQKIDVPVPHVELAVSSDVVGSPRAGEQDTPVAASTAGALSAGEARPTGISTHSVSTASVAGVFSVESGSSRPSKKDTTFADATALGKSADDARLPASVKNVAKSLDVGGLMRLPSTEPRQNPNPQRLMVELGLRGPKQWHDQWRRSNSCKVCR